MPPAKCAQFKAKANRLLKMINTEKFDSGLPSVLINAAKDTLEMVVYGKRLKKFRSSS